MPATLVGTEDRRPHAAPLPGAAAIAACTVFAILFLWVESETAVASLLLASAAAVVVGERLGWLGKVQTALAQHDTLLNGGAVVGVLAIAAFFYRDHFALLMVATVLLYVLACHRKGEGIRFPVEGVDGGSVSMLSVQVG